MLAAWAAGSLAPCSGLRMQESKPPPRACWDASKWFGSGSGRLKVEHKVSQGNQDSVLAALFDATALGLPDKQPYYVEFGFPRLAGSNTEWLRTHLNFTGTRFGNAPPELGAHYEWITDDNIVSLFEKYNVPTQPDYVSIDIDSCDLWVFRALVNHRSPYRPKVLTVEFNSNYPFESMKTLGKEQCKKYTWNWDPFYGTSLGALRAVAEHSGYSLVFIEPHLDAFFVRSDLICAGSEIDPERFREYTNIPWNTRNAKRFTDEQRDALIVDYDPSA